MEKLPKNVVTSWHNKDKNILKEPVYNTKPFKIELTDEVIASDSGIAMTRLMPVSLEFTEALKPVSKTVPHKDYKNVGFKFCWDKKCFFGLLKNILPLFLIHVYSR